MKKIKFAALCMAFVLCAGLLAGCGNSAANDSDGGTVNSGSNGSTVGNDGNGSMGNTSLPLTGTVTLKQFLDNGPKVGFVTRGESPAKDYYPRIYLFEDGKVYLVSTWAVDGRPGDNLDYPYYHSAMSEGAHPLTFGDIAQMTDEELLEFAEAHKTLEWMGQLFSGSDDKDRTRISSRITGEYSLHVYSDKTGNSTEYEIIDLGDNTIRCEETEQATVYTSVFYGFNTLYFRAGTDLTLTLDNVGDAGVAID